MMWRKERWCVEGCSGLGVWRLLQKASRGRKGKGEGEKSPILARVSNVDFACNTIHRVRLKVQTPPKGPLAAPHETVNSFKTSLDGIPSRTKKQQLTSQTRNLSDVPDAVNFQCHSRAEISQKQVTCTPRDTKRGYKSSPLHKTGIY